MNLEVYFMEILKVENLIKTYGSGENLVNAVDDVSFSVYLQSSPHFQSEVFQWALYSRGKRFWLALRLYLLWYGWLWNTQSRRLINKILLKQSEMTISEHHIQPADCILLKFVDNSFTLCYNVVVTTATTIFCMFSLLTGGLLI